MFDLTALGFPPGTVLNVRDALLAIVVLLAVYILAVVLRYRRLRRQAEEAQPDEPAEKASAPAAEKASAPAAAEAPAAASGARLYAAVQDTAQAPASAAPREHALRQEPAVAPAPLAPPLPVNLAAEVADTPVVQAIERDLTMLRQEIQHLQGELERVQGEMRDRFTQLQATQHMSPLYSDAMQMAAAGHDAQTIADRCNIARAEADLVVALVRNQGGG
ncbi:DUF2802 domain-containing protein [Oryzomicrobium sp.]|uniref:DUF2802 domain-containing protein n=1 Tax=Oryzomicrobium sp. TaxID=1911578 RepID=UPI0025EF299A|nr:DUF2802 domain-containing protein [Oryzomicrobium sp.]MCE1244722.1 DUF2802 domain-containing protein [Oryzomicrobium sp.]